MSVWTAVVKPGDRPIVEIVNPPAEKMAWIGFYEADAGDKDYIKYSYLNALDNNTYRTSLRPMKRERIIHGSSRMRVISPCR